MYIYLYDYVCYLRTQTTQRSYIYYNYLFQYMLILFFKNMQSLPVSTFLRLPQTPFFIQVVSIWGFPGGSVWRIYLQCRRHRRLGFDPWRRAWQPTPVFLPGPSHGQRSLLGHGLWVCKELDMTEATEHTCTHLYFSISPFHTIGNAFQHDKAVRVWHRFSILWQ